MFEPNKTTVAGRREIVNKAKLENAFEGIMPTAKVQKILDRYIEGKMSLKEGIYELIKGKVKVA